MLIRPFHLKLFHWGCRKARVSGFGENMALLLRVKAELIPKATSWEGLGFSPKQVRFIVQEAPITPKRTSPPHFHLEVVPPNVLIFFPNILGHVFHRLIKKVVTRILDALPVLFAHLHASCKARSTPETLERQHHQRGSLGTTAEDWEASSVGMKNNLRTALRRPQVGDAMKLVDKGVKQGPTPVRGPHQNPKHQTATSADQPRRQPRR